jgi:hypothetical protein
MRKSIVLAACLTVATPALGQSSHYARGYVTKNGTYVAPHYQTNPDSSLLNNWSTKGNYNPTQGRRGPRTHTLARTPTAAVRHARLRHRRTARALSARMVPATAKILTPTHTKS